MDKKKTSDNKWNKQILPPDGIPLLLFIIDHQFFPFPDKTEEIENKEKSKN